MVRKTHDPVFKYLFGDKAEQAAHTFDDLLWLGSYAVGAAVIAPIPSQNRPAFIRPARACSARSRAV